jgi:hypothetical protein
MSASRSLVRVPPSARVVPEGAGRGGAECQSATTYIGGTGTGTRPGGLPFDPSTMVRCQDYHAHQTSHHRDGIGWTCGICSGVTP